MITRTDFAPADRYVYDCGACSVAKGFAQVDTSQDAPYFGTWANPEKWILVNYCEGDVTIQTAETEEEFVNALRRLATADWHRFLGIDAMCDETLEARFKAMGLEDLLH